MKKKLLDLGKDGLTYGISTIVGQIASLFLVPYFSNELDPKDYGILSIISLIIVFINPIASLSIDGALFRFFSLSENENQERTYYTVATILKSLSVVIFSLILIPFYSFFDKYFFEGALTIPLYTLLIVSVIIESFSSLTVIILRSKRRVKTIAINNIIYVLVSISCSIFLVLYLHLGVIGALIAGVMAGFIRTMLFIKVGNSTFQIDLWSKKIAFEMLSYCLPMIPHKIQGNMITLFTTFMINQKMGLVYSGLYAVATRVSKPVSFVVTIVQQSWTPYKYQIHKTDENPSKTFSELITFYWIFIIFLWVSASVMAPSIFRLLVNKKYHDGISYIPFIMFVSVAQAFYFTVTTGFELKKKQNKIILASFLGLVTLVLSSILTVNFYTPYSFFIIQSIPFFILSLVIFPEAKQQIIIKYPFRIISIYFLIGLAIMIFFYFNQGVTNLIISLFALLISTIIIIITAFPKIIYQKNYLIKFFHR